MKQLSNKVRSALMAVMAVAVIVLGLVGATWSTPALAEGTVGVSEPTVTPTVTTTPKTAGAPCNTTLILNDVTEHFIASGVLSPAPSAENICTLLQVVPESNTAFPITFPEFQVKATGLFGADRVAIPASPAGYTRLNDAVQFAGYTKSSLRMCFDMPTGSYKSLRIAYYDTTPTIDRWVFLRTGTVNGQICMTRGLRSPLPAVFALFGQQ
jgi:hypothetical protein